MTCNLQVIEIILATLPVQMIQKNTNCIAPGSVFACMKHESHCCTNQTWNFTSP